MCGRYASSRKADDLVEHFAVTDVRADVLPPSYNVAPTTEQYVVVERDDGGDATRQLRAFRWGLVPSWATDMSIGGRLINARAETIAGKPAFRRPLARRRCIVPADGYFEWLRDPAGKQPFFIRPRDGFPIAMAGVYEIWSSPDAADGSMLWSFTIVTTAADDAVRHIHDRMPVLLPPERWDAWLDPANQDVERVVGLLAPARVGLDAFPVSRAVNSVRNDSPALVEPVPAEPPPLHRNSRRQFRSGESVDENHVGDRLF